MDGCIELTGSEPNTTYFMKDSKIIAKRVISDIYKGTVEKWYKDGKLHRDSDLPAEIHRHENGQKSSEWWCKDGKLHRDGDLPAEIYYHKNREKYIKSWYKDDKLHRDGDLPAGICYHENGQKYKEYWLKDDTFHRLRGPAQINTLGTQITQKYYHNGEFVPTKIGEWVSILPEITAAIKTLPWPIFMEIRYHLYKINLYDTV